MSDPKLIPNMFSTYELTDDQALEGSRLTTLQTMVIQNLLANTAISRTNLEVDVANPNEFAQQEAFLKGQIELLQYILDSSIAANESLTLVEV